VTDDLTDDLQQWSAIEGNEDWAGLLIGNGFSQNLWQRFGYASLFETASQGDGAQLSAADISLFDRLETRNFEVVLSALATSKAVSAALEQPLAPFSEREDSIRQALIRAVHSVHVPWLSVPDAHLDHTAAELSRYASIYCTNYDLMLYWSLMREPSAFRDYFWSEQFDITNTEVWGKKTKVHFLHGGLHLYRRPNGQTLKRSAAAGQNLLDLFGTPYGDAMPLFISEGTAQEKLASIYRSDYLSFVFACLAQVSHWGAVSRRVVRAFSGRSNLPVHELAKAKVEKPHGRTRPLPKASGNVQFSAWRLAHAVKKADCLRWPAAPIRWVSIGVEL
jgi:hypothetical protein